MDNENNLEYGQINLLYDECLGYLSKVNHSCNTDVNIPLEFTNKYDVHESDDEETVFDSYNSDVKVPLEFSNGCHVYESGYETAMNNDPLEYRHEIITDVITEEPNLETYEGEKENDYESIVELKELAEKISDKLPENNDNEVLDRNKHETYQDSVKKYNVEIGNNSIDEIDDTDPGYETIKETKKSLPPTSNKTSNESTIHFKIENETQPLGSSCSLPGDIKSERLRKLSLQLPKIIITQSNSSLSKHGDDAMMNCRNVVPTKDRKPKPNRNPRNPPPHRGYASDYPKRLVSKCGLENVALISNVPFERIRLLNDTFHTLINLRWRWIVMGTVVLHFTLWLIFAVFWYITALAHYDFEPNPPKRTCITGGTDFVTIFLASVEAQTTIGFGDRAIDEECPDSIFLFIVQLILGTGLSGVLTCVVYAKLTRPEKLSRDGVGFSKKAVISMRDGRLCLMMRAWDLNYDHIISSEFTAHFVNTYRTKEGETIRFFAQTMALQQKQFLLWPVTLVHVIDSNSPLYGLSPSDVANNNYEITLSLKGASASMGTFTQSQTSYLPKELLWGHRFLPVVKYDSRKQKYVIEYSKLESTEPVDTPYCSASEINGLSKENAEEAHRGSTPSSFSDRMTSFQLERSSSFKRKANKT